MLGMTVCGDGEDRLVGRGPNGGRLRGFNWVGLGGGYLASCNIAHIC